jgi:hypothetical protein
VIVAGGINFETDLGDVWVAAAPDTHAVFAAAAANSAPEYGIDNSGEDQ